MMKSLARVDAEFYDLIPAALRQAALYHREGAQLAKRGKIDRHEAQKFESHARGMERFAERLEKTKEREVTQSEFTLVMSSLRLARNIYLTFADLARSKKKLDEARSHEIYSYRFNQVIEILSPLEKNAPLH